MQPIINFSDEAPVKAESKGHTADDEADDDDGIVEIETNEFEGFDDEEFENWSADQADEVADTVEKPQTKDPKKSGNQEPKLTVAKVHF